MSETIVLIVGAGPTGLTLAVDLARRGLSFRLIEAATTPFEGSRGKGIQPRTLEIFDDLGVVDVILAAGGPYPKFRTHFGPFSLRAGSLASSKQTQSRVIQNPRFSDGAEAFDACIVEHSTLLVFEHKASVIPSAIKYADKPEELRNILERRFVVGDGLRRQGLSQIFNSLNRFAEGDRLLDRTSDLPVEPKAIRKIMPVLVHLDNTLRTPAINHYMAGRFRALGRLKRYIVTPLVLLPITELEEIEGQLREHRMSEILESFLSLLRTDKTSVFLASILPILRGKLRDPGPTLQRFDQYMTGMSARLFPDETRSQN